MSVNKKNLPGQLSAVRAILLILAVVLIVILAVIGLYMLNGGSSDDIPLPSDTEDTPFSSFEKIASLLANGKTDDFEKLSIPSVSIEDAFSVLETNTSYYQKCTVTRSNGSSSTVQEKHILRDGEKYNIKTYQDNLLTETLICDGKNICIINEATKSKSVLSVDSSFTVPELASLPDHTKIMELYQSYKENGNESSGELDNCSLSLLRALDMNMLIVNMNFEDTNVTERYYYYLNYGLIYSCDTILSGKTVYSFLTTDFKSDITTLINEDSFKID